jgi:hypothetical protein
MEALWQRGIEYDLKGKSNLPAHGSKVRGKEGKSPLRKTIPPYACLARCARSVHNNTMRTMEPPIITTLHIVSRLLPPPHGNQSFIYWHSKSPALPRPLQRLEPRSRNKLADDVNLRISIAAAGSARKEKRCLHDATLTPPLSSSTVDQPSTLSRNSLGSGENTIQNQTEPDYCGQPPPSSQISLIILPITCLVYPLFPQLLCDVKILGAGIENAERFL